MSIAAKKAHRELLTAFAKWLSLPDYSTVEIVAAAVLANRLPGDPLWLAIIGPSSAGKTEILRALEGLRGIHFIDHLTSRTLISGYRRARGDKGSHSLVLTLLNSNDPHVIVIEDFSTILKKHPVERGEIFTQLRKLYDGRISGFFGNEERVKWQGKVGMIVGSTGAYDSEIQDEATFGDRFTLWRAQSNDGRSAAERAIRNSPSAVEMREELRYAFSRLDKLELPGEVKLPLEARSLIADLASFVAHARTPVRRDRYSREVDAMPETEGAARLGLELGQLLRGLLILHGVVEPGEAEIDLLERAAFASIPSMRLSLIRSIGVEGGLLSEILKRSAIPETLVRRGLEDLRLVGLVEWQPEAARRLGYHRPLERFKPFFYHAERLALAIGGDDEET